MDPRKPNWNELETTPRGGGLGGYLGGYDVDAPKSRGAAIDAPTVSPTVVGTLESIRSSLVEIDRLADSLSSLACEIHGTPSAMLDVPSEGKNPDIPSSLIGQLGYVNERLYAVIRHLNATRGGLREALGVE